MRYSNSVWQSKNCWARKVLFWHIVNPGLISVMTMGLPNLPGMIPENRASKPQALPVMGPKLKKNKVRKKKVNTIVKVLPRWQPSFEKS